MATILDLFALGDLKAAAKKAPPSEGAASRREAYPKSVSRN